MEKRKNDEIDSTADQLMVLKETAISLLKTKINHVFPVGGAIINEFVFDLYGRIKQERVNKFVEELEKKTLKLEAQTVKQEYLKSEEFFDFTMKIFENATKLNSETKRKALANIYVNAIYSSKTNLDFDLLFSDFVVSITESQIQILSFVNLHKNELNEISSYDNYFKLFKNYHSESSLTKYEFRYFNTDLEAKSLIAMGAGLDNFDSTSQLKATEDHKDASVIVTDLGQRFIEFLVN